MKNDRFLRVLKGEDVDRPPLWLMRQAGRYLPEYRELRAKSSGFLDFVEHPEWTSAAVMQPLERFPLDAAILFSDILVLPRAMGMGLTFSAGEGPRVSPTVTTMDLVNELEIPDINKKCDFVLESVKQTKILLDDRVPLIGFAGAPWTVACYGLQGEGGREFALARRECYAQPKVVKKLIEKLEQATIEYLCAQVTAGVDALMLFDSWAGLCPLPVVNDYVLQPIATIVSELKRRHPDIPVIVFTKGMGNSINSVVKNISADAFGIDWGCSLLQARQQVGSDVVLQGNFDPMLLFADPDEITRTVQTTLAALPTTQRLIVNLGHGLHPQTPIAGVEAFCKAVTQWENVK